MSWTPTCFSKHSRCSILDTRFYSSLILLLYGMAKTLGIVTAYVKPGTEARGWCCVVVLRLPETERIVH